MLFSLGFSLHEPCPSCEAPYGYHNVMRLSTDTHLFAVSQLPQKEPTQQTTRIV